MIGWVNGHLLLAMLAAGAAEPIAAPSTGT